MYFCRKNASKNLADSKKLSTFAIANEKNVCVGY